MTIRLRISVLLACGVLAASPVPPLAAQTCEDGELLTPGKSCDLAVKWGHDHWVRSDFAENKGNEIEFSHLEGDCKVSLFGPIEGLLTPGGEPVTSGLPGEYHLFTRAITLAQQDCIYRITVK